MKIGDVRCQTPESLRILAYHCETRRKKKCFCGEMVERGSVLEHQSKTIMSAWNFLRFNLERQEKEAVPVIRRCRSRMQ